MYISYQNKQTPFVNTNTLSIQVWRIRKFKRTTIFEGILKDWFQKLTRRLLNEIRCVHIKERERVIGMCKDQNLKK
jgi:hypothetical protein